MKQCQEVAKIEIGWGEKINYMCPYHANNAVVIGNHIGFPVRATPLSTTASVQCSSYDPIDKNGIELNKTFDGIVGWELKVPDNFNPTIGDVPKL